MYVSVWRRLNEEYAKIHSQSLKQYNEKFNDLLETNAMVYMPKQEVLHWFGVLRKPPWGRVAHTLGDHQFFPYCYGIILPNRLVLQMLGECDDALSVNNFGQIVNLISKIQLVELSRQLLKAISFMHHYTPS